MLTRGARRSIAGEEGSALVTVLIVMSILTIAGLTLAAIVVNTAGMVADTRSTAQSRAAADAGLAQALVLATRDKDICDDVPVESQPVVGDLGAGSTYSVARDCSVTGSAVYTSTGRGPGGAVTRTQAVYSYVPTPAVVKEPALVTRAPLNLSALKIRAVDPANPASVWVIPDTGISGDFTCNSGGAIAGSVYLPAGMVLGVGGCEVTGDVYAERDVTVGTGTKIHGKVVSLSGKVKVSGGSPIDGGVYAKGDVTLDSGAIVHGDVVSSAGSVTTTGGLTIDGSIYAKNNVVVTGASNKFVQSIYAGANLTVSGGAPIARDRIMYGGAFTYPHSGERAWAVSSVERTTLQPVVALPKLPNAPEWQGITQSDIDSLVTSGAFEKITWSGACAYAWWPEHEMVAKIRALTRPTVIDATRCSQLMMEQFSGTTAIKTDIVFVAPSFAVTDQKFSSADAKPHRMWFISPESPGRDCSKVPPISIKGTSMLPTGGKSPISAMIFTQCTANFPNGGEDWQGSVQAGTMTGQPNYWYTPVGFPGSKAPGDDTTPGPGAAATLGTLVSRYDVTP
ncbi:polymer-forming cytoskeletal protein [Microbacterium flavum]|uniref:Polymer-forming cytoskeletal protein n=1 Tax=Microbacterium flavum TaxID=415216 RepID=A0ABS5XV58_9MICO|nr:polymer-forming cytoskeletal protein [Microbacterium flavum]MBT8797013.1 polymer-forming cytoskeletal protein [Microbacterium flavum]